MGAALPKPVLTTVVERHVTKDFRIYVAEMNGFRKSMEDAHIIYTDDMGAGYFGILDGHGGEACSEWCAQRLHDKLASGGVPTDDAIAKKLVLAVDAEFLDTQQSSGSTAAMCIVREDASGKYKLHVINAGDSRVLLSRADGTIVDGGGTDSGLSNDHKPEVPSERERIYRCGGTVEDGGAGGCARVNGSLSVSRGFGDADCKRTGGPRQEDHPVTCDPEMGHFECDATDFLLIVCDGVSEGDFPNPEVCLLAAKVLQETGGDAAAACEAVCHKAVETNSKDNISAMIVLMGNGGAPPSVTKGFTPGSVLSCDKSDFTKAYVAMCKRAGVTFAEAVEARYELLAARSGGGAPPRHYAPSVAHTTLHTY